MGSENEDICTPNTCTSSTPRGQPRFCRVGLSNEAGINVESRLAPAMVADLQALGHEFEVIDGPCQNFGAGQFIWRMRDPAVEGYQLASDPRRDGLAAGF